MRFWLSGNRPKERTSFHISVHILVTLHLWLKIWGNLNFEKWHHLKNEAHAISFTGQLWKTYSYLLFTVVSITVNLFTGFPKSVIKHLQLTALITHTLKSLHLLPISYKIYFKLLLVFFKSPCGLALGYISDFLTVNVPHRSLSH